MKYMKEEVFTEIFGGNTLNGQGGLSPQSKSSELA